MAYHFNDSVYTQSFTPREYQVELLEAAKEHNIIVCLGSSSGKIFIATKLIQELATAIRRPFRHGGGKRTLYVVDTVSLVSQQAAYIRHLTDLSVGEYSSSEDIDLWGVEEWEHEFSENQVLVMTSDVCFNIMQYHFVTLSDLNLIVLDECHRALKKHPMRQLMREFEECWERPRVLGLTAPLLNSSCDPSRLEGELRRLELTLHSSAETASDIVSVLRYCTKPRELVVEYALPQATPLDSLLEKVVVDAKEFIQDHRYDPSEVYEDEFQEELRAIPDPKIDPLKIFEDFLAVLHTLGAWCADKAAYVLLIKLEKLKVKTPYERHFLLLCTVSTVMVRVRAICDDVFQAFEEKERIYKYSSPKVLRLLEILKQFKPARSAESEESGRDTMAAPTEGEKNPPLSGDMSVAAENVSDDSPNAERACESESKQVSRMCARVSPVVAPTDRHVPLDPALPGSESHIARTCLAGNVEGEVGNNCDHRHHQSCVNETGCILCISVVSDCGPVPTVDFTNEDVVRKCTALNAMNGKVNHINGVSSSVLSTRLPAARPRVHEPECAGDMASSNKESVIESVLHSKDDGSAWTQSHCDSAQPRMVGAGGVLEEGKSRPVTPLRNVSRLRGYKYSRKGFYREDGNRGDAALVATRQVKGFVQDDADALCGIVFVEQRFTAKILYHLLNDLRRFDEDFSFLTPQYTVDKMADPVTDPREAEIEHRKQEEVLKRFRMRECNLLVGTAVLEEGIDVPKCNLVIHFDVPAMYRSYVQSKGRARAQDAFYILMIVEDRTSAFVRDLAQYYEIEQMLLRKCANQEPPDSEEKEADKYNDVIEAYRPTNSPTNASVNMATAVALVNRYCAKLPSDTFTRLTPMCSIQQIESNGHQLYTCTVRLPINSPVKQDIVGLPMPSAVLARRIAALEACRVLHQACELDDNLLPVGKESFRIHDDDDAGLALEDVDDTVPRDANEPRPGTTKRRQYYYKRIAESLTDCRPIPGQPAFLYHINMVLTCPLPDEQNTRGRKIYPPEDSPQGFGILTLKQIPKICPFPIFTRSGEVSVRLELSGAPIVLTRDKLEKIVTFLNYTFTSVLRLQKYLMMFDPQASENSYFIVPTRKVGREVLAEVDWDFLERIYENRDLRPHPVPQQDREGFVFDAAKYHDAVIMPWYRNQDQPQYFYVAEICSHLNPKSSFPGSEYKTFDEYYYKKYGIQIQNSRQPLLDVDHTSARLNFLTPRYVNRKGVALPTSSEETKRAKRENLEQKQILVPELCTVHPFPASLWRKAVCLPCILYRVNALLLADQIRRQVAYSIGLGRETLAEDFEWPPLDFGWSLADVLRKSKEGARSCEGKGDGEEMSRPPRPAGKEEASERPLEDEEPEEEDEEEDKDKVEGEWMEIGTWSNDMADHHHHRTFALPDVDDFDPAAALPANLTLLAEDDELGELQAGGSDWGTGICSRRREHVRYGSPSSWLGGLEQDLEGFETDDSYSEPGNDCDRCDGLRIEFKGDNVAEAVEDEQEGRRNGPAEVADVGDSDSHWDWDGEDGEMDEDEDEELERLAESYARRFEEATRNNQHRIETSGILVRKDAAFAITRKLHGACDGASEEERRPRDVVEEGHAPAGKEGGVSEGHNQSAAFIAGKQVVFRCSLSVFSDDSGLSEDDSCRNSSIEAYPCPHSDSSETDELAELDDEDVRRFSFDAQPALEGHPGPSPSVILQALTMSNANDGINLERLETIGDSFLKYAITTYLYCTYENIHEGKLSHLRSKQVSNLNLYRLGRRKVFGESMIATKFEPHDNWLPPCYYVPRELERALIEAGVPASHWNRADLPALRDLSRDEICELVRERSERLRVGTIDGEEVGAAGAGVPPAGTAGVDSLPCFIPYNLITQHSIPDKSVADSVEALIGAYLISSGPRGALLYMSWLGICVLPKEEMVLTEFPQDRLVGTTLPVRVDEPGANTVWKQVRYGHLRAPRSPLLRHVANPESELERLLDGYDAFERRIGYRFRDQSYLLQALTHASYSPNRLTDCYQRLEFLGDAVLDYLITRHLYEDVRLHSPGALTDLRSALVNNTIFASLAVRYGFHKYFRHLSPGLNDVVDRFVRIQEENGHTISEEYYLIEEEECEEAEDVEVPKALGDVFESVAGAIFMDSNMSLDAVWKVYYRMMRAEIEQFSTSVPKSPIRELLELEPETAKFGKPEKLADGRRVRVTVEVFGKGTFKGIGRNYRIAKCTAAKCALKQLKKKGLLARKPSDKLLP